MSEAPLRGRDRLAPPEALAAFDDAMVKYRQADAPGSHQLFERAHRRAPADARIMSWYGLTLVLVERNSNLGILYCDQALRIAGPQPALLLNLARAHLALGQRERAVRAIQRGLAASPEDPGLQAAQRSMGWRRRPVLPFFGRSNPLNRWLGRLRHRWSRRLRPVPPTTAMMLGVLEEEPRSGG